MLRARLPLGLIKCRAFVDRRAGQAKPRFVPRAVYQNSAAPVEKTDEKRMEEDLEAGRSMKGASVSKYPNIARLIADTPNPVGLFIEINWEGQQQQREVAVRVFALWRESTRGRKITTVIAFFVWCRNREILQAEDMHALLLDGEEGEENSLTEFRVLLFNRLAERIKPEWTVANQRPDLLLRSAEQRMSEARHMPNYKRDLMFWVGQHMVGAIANGAVPDSENMFLKVRRWLAVLYAETAEMHELREAVLDVVIKVSGAHLHLTGSDVNRLRARYILGGEEVAIVVEELDKKNMLLDAVISLVGEDVCLPYSIELFSDLIAPKLTLLIDAEHVNLLDKMVAFAASKRPDTRSMVGPMTDLANAVVGSLAKDSSFVLRWKLAHAVGRQLAADWTLGNETLEAQVSALCALYDLALGKDANVAAWLKDRILFLGCAGNQMLLLPEKLRISPEEVFYDAYMKMKLTRDDLVAFAHYFDFKIDQTKVPSEAFFKRKDIPKLNMPKRATIIFLADKTLRALHHALLDAVERKDVEQTWALYQEALKHGVVVKTVQIEAQSLLVTAPKMLEQILGVLSGESLNSFLQVLPGASAAFTAYRILSKRSALTPAVMVRLAVGFAKDWHQDDELMVASAFCLSKAKTAPEEDVDFACKKIAKMVVSDQRAVLLANLSLWFQLPEELLNRVRDAVVLLDPRRQDVALQFIDKIAALHAKNSTILRGREITHGTDARKLLLETVVDGVPYVATVSDWVIVKFLETYNFVPNKDAIDPVKPIEQSPRDVDDDEDETPRHRRVRHFQ